MINTEAQRHREVLESDLTGTVIGAAIEVHRTLGPGLLESVYEECLCHELALRGIRFERQVELPLIYKDAVLNAALRIDIVVEGSVIVEVKAIEHVLPVHGAQLLSYMRLSHTRVGLLLNFNSKTMKDGITRRVI